MIDGILEYRQLSKLKGTYVEALPELLDDQDRAALRRQRLQLTELLASMVPDSEPPPPELPDQDLINGLAQFLDLPPSARQQLLEQEGPRARARASVWRSTLGWLIAWWNRSSGGAWREPTSE